MVQKRDVISVCRICQGDFYRTQGSASDLQAANARLGQKAYFCQARKITKSLTSSIDVAKFLVSREAKGQVNFLVFFFVNIVEFSTFAKITAKATTVIYQEAN